MRPLLGFATCVLVGLALFPSSIRAADQQHVARPGTLNYVEGQVTLGSKSLDALSIGTVGLDPGQTLTTQNGKAELLLTHGVFVRLGPSSAATMIASGLTSTRLSVDEGEAFVEVTEIHPENDLRILEDGVSTELVKMGLYNFNANLHVVRVLDGEAIVDDGEKSVTVKAIHMVDLSAVPLKVQKFDKKETEVEDLYHWTSLRSAYLAEANADYAPTYSLGGFGAGTGTAGIGIHGLTRTRFFPETASSIVPLVGVSIHPGVPLALLCSGVVITIIISAPPMDIGDQKRTTSFRQITATAFITRLATARIVHSWEQEVEVCTAVDSIVVAFTASVVLAVKDSTEAVEAIASRHYQLIKMRPALVRLLYEIWRNLSRVGYISRYGICGNMHPKGSRWPG
ncbi:MAG: hypothetical protein WBL50_17140 [Candidatus Acidiferrum sp.]